MSEPILVLSHNAALSGLIARILRWREVYSTILPVNTKFSVLQEQGVKGVVLAADTPDDSLLDELDPAILQSGLPVLALGGAAPLLCRWHGGSFGPWEKRRLPLSLPSPTFPFFGKSARANGCCIITRRFP